MKTKILSALRVQQCLSAATQSRVLVVGDVMLDQFIWGGGARRSGTGVSPVRSDEPGHCGSQKLTGGTPVPLPLT